MMRSMGLTGKLSRMEDYRPFSKHTAFKVVKAENGVNWLWHTRLHYRIQCPNGFGKPRTGLLLCHYLDSSGSKVPLVLDIGTGASAILAIHCARMGARKVIAIDVDRAILRIAQQNVDENALSKTITVLEGDVSHFVSEQKADLIVANLPHMPVPAPISQHDDGGPDGRARIIALLLLIRKCLRSDGVAIFTAPDYIGVNASYSSTESIRQIAACQGINVRVERKFKMEVRPGSYTAENMNWITNQYPDYKFNRTKAGYPTHWLFLVSARLIPESNVNQPIRAILFDLGNTLIYERVDDIQSLDQLPLRLMPHAKDVLRHLASQYRLGIVTDTETSGECAVRSALKRLGVANFFSAIVTSTDVGVRKPDQKIFNEALRRMNAKPSATVMIGDNYSRDIVGAKSVGLLTILYRSTNVDLSLNSEHADYCVSSLDEIPALITNVSKNRQNVSATI